MTIHPTSHLLKPLLLLPLLFAHTANGDINDELYQAATAGNTAEVEQLLKQGANADAKNRNGWAALTSAAGGGHTEIVMILIAAGADVNAKHHSTGETALMSAAGGRRTETVKVLIAAGADVNASADREGKTAIIFALMGGHTEIIDILKRAGAHSSDLELLKAAKAGNTAEVEQLLKQGADVNAKLGGGPTVLMSAAAGGHTEIVTILIAAGANVNAKDKSGWTALIVAARYGRTETVKVLIEAGADVNAKRHLETALISAAGGGHTEIVMILIAAGADVNSTPLRGKTALTSAAAGGHTEIVMILIEAVADVNAMEMDGSTALSLAAQKRNSEIVNVLKQAGAQAETMAYGDINAVSIGIVLLIIAAIIFRVAPNFVRATLIKIIGGRANREQFFLVFALCIVAPIIENAVPILEPLPELSYAFLLLLLVVCSYFLITTGIKRLHDYGASGWWSLVAFVPVARYALLLFLLFASGTPGLNGYGQESDTKSYRVLQIVGYPVAGLFVGAITPLVIFALVARSGGADFVYSLMFAPLVAFPFGITGAVVGLVIGLVIGVRRGKLVLPSTNPPG